MTPDEAKEILDPYDHDTFHFRMMSGFDSQSRQLSTEYMSGSMPARRYHKAMKGLKEKFQAYAPHAPDWARTRAPDIYGGIALKEGTQRSSALRRTSTFNEEPTPDPNHPLLQSLVQR